MSLRLEVSRSQIRLDTLRMLALVLAGLLLHAGEARPAPGPKPAGRCKNGGIPSGNQCIMPLRAEISGFDSNGLPTILSGDGLGAYSHNVEGVTSYTKEGDIGGNWGNWYFDTYSSTTRTVGHTFATEEAVTPENNPNYISPANPPFWGTQSLRTHFSLKCTNIGRNMLTMQAGTTTTCPMTNRFDVGGADYALSPIHSLNGFPETTDLQVRCNLADSVGCKDWFIDPIDLGQAVGRLVPMSDITINDGAFYMRFHIHLIRQWP